MNIPVRNLFNDLMQILNTRCYFGAKFAQNALLRIPHYYHHCVIPHQRKEKAKGEKEEEKKLKKRTNHYSIRSKFGVKRTRS